MGDAGVAAIRRLQGLSPQGESGAEPPWQTKGLNEGLPAP